MEGLRFVSLLLAALVWFLAVAACEGERGVTADPAESVEFKQPTPAIDVVVVEDENAAQRERVRELIGYPLPLSATEINIRTQAVMVRWVYVWFNLPPADAKAFMTTHRQSIAPVQEGSDLDRFVSRYDAWRESRGELIEGFEVIVGGRPPLTRRYWAERMPSGLVRVTIVLSEG